MSSESVRRMRRATLLCLAMLTLSVESAFAVKPDSVNPKDDEKKFWVARRHKTDPDGRDNLALAIRLEYDDGEDKTSARIWQYSSVEEKEVNENGKKKKVLKYVSKDAPIDCLVEPVQLGVGNNIKLEKLELILKGSDTKIGWITRWQGGKGSPSGHKKRENARLIFRYSKHFPRRTAAKPTPSSSDKASTELGCEDPPADDVLEEESLDPGEPDPAMDPPDISYEP